MEVEANAKRKHPAMWPQWIAGLGVTFLLTQIGLMSGWTSPYIALLSSPHGPFHITQAEATVVASILNIGRIIGAVLGSVCVNYFGSKTSILITSTPMALCWIFTIAANQVVWLYLARICGGIGIGMAYSCFSLYLGEIADPNIRGALVSLGMSGLSIGNLIISVMGAYLTMEISGSVNLLLCCVLAALFLWLPESPHHLIKQHRADSARNSIRFYHRDCDVEVELIELKNFVEYASGQSFFTVLKEFRSPPIKKGMVIVCFLYMYGQMSGVNSVLFYMESILRHCHLTIIDPSTVVIIVMVFGIVSSCVSMILIDRFGRTILMMISTFVIATAMIGFGVEFELLEIEFDPRKMQWLPILAAIVFQVAMFIGALSVPSAVLGEIFAPNVKCVAACFGSVLAGILSFVSTVTYQPLVNGIKYQFVFWLYALHMFTGVAFTYLCVPETKGKSLQQIQEELGGKKTEFPHSFTPSTHF